MSKIMYDNNESDHPLISQDFYKILPIYATNDYAKFSKMTINRQIKQSHVAKIKKSLLAYGFMDDFPLICKLDKNNDTLIIIAGQHRFEAAKEAKIPLKYRVLSHFTTLKDISHILLAEHGNGKNRDWTDDETANIYANLGSDVYIELLRFSAEFNMPIKTAAQFILGFDLERGLCLVKNPIDHFKNGTLSFSTDDLDHARKTAAKIDQFLFEMKNFGHAKPPKSASAIKAMYLIVSHQHFDFKNFRKFNKLFSPSKPLCLDGQLAPLLIRICDIYNKNRRSDLMEFPKIEKGYRLKKAKYI